MSTSGCYRGKAGISWPVQELTSDPVNKFFQPGSKLSWHYNWNKNYTTILPDTSPSLSIVAEFVPMIFAPDYFNNEFELQDGWKMLLGYNEPDHGDASVAVKTTPTEAAKAWTELAKLRTSPDIKLVSPAVAFNTSWLKVPTCVHGFRLTFSGVLRHTKPDYLAIHVYTTTFESFRSRVEEYWDEFGLPIIITEMAMTVSVVPYEADMESFDPSVPPPASQQQVHDFMGQTTQWLDSTSYILRYAWFGATRDASNLHGVHPFNRLMDDEGELTPLGWQYINGGHD